MQVLITGGAGFPASHLSEELLARGHRVHVLDDYHLAAAVMAFERFVRYSEQERRERCDTEPNLGRGAGGCCYPLRGRFSRIRRVGRADRRRRASPPGGWNRRTNRAEAHAASLAARADRLPLAVRERREIRLGLATGGQQPGILSGWLVVELDPSEAVDPLPMA